jgi:hypothetical protein
MSPLADTRFYVQKPCDEDWNVSMTPSVIEARSINPSEEGLCDWQKTDKFVQENFKVIAPEDFGWPCVDKRSWVECSGPARPLKYMEYVHLYHSLDPARPLPKGVVIKKI